MHWASVPQGTMPSCSDCAENGTKANGSAWQKKSFKRAVLENFRPHIMQAVKPWVGLAGECRSQNCARGWLAQISSGWFEIHSSQQPIFQGKLGLR